MNVLACGDQAVLIDCDSLAEAQSWFAALQGSVEVVLGARTVLVRGVPAQVRSLIASTIPADIPATGTVIVEIPVTYNGPDLDDVAALAGLTTREIVAAHTDSPWTVAFGGFAPGFAYLVGGDPRLAVPRRHTPRTSVPAGAVGLAGEFSGIYPRASPGGWQLIGQTSQVMWDSHRDPPALLMSGSRVQFVIA